MLKEITDFLIQVGKHCLECEEKNNTIIKPTTPIADVDVIKKQYSRGIKQCYLEKWIQNGVFEVFTLNQFYTAYPMQKENRKLDSNISKLIADKKIVQLGKNKFKVNR